MDLAVRLHRAGLLWKPAPGDRFNVPDRGLDDEVFVLSDMTIQVHDLPKGATIGFNGTVEWALDDVAKEEAVWLPREDQLRELLGGAFLGLARGATGYRVTIALPAAEVSVEADRAADAYALALLRLMAAAGLELPEPAQLD